MLPGITARTFSSQTPRLIYAAVLVFLSCLVLMGCKPAPSKEIIPPTPVPIPEESSDKYILYTSQGEVLLTNLAGEMEEKLYSTGRNNWFPVVSPDNNQVAYWSMQSGFFELWVYDFQKQAAQQITFFNEKILSPDYQNFNVHNAPTWTPDSRTLIFSRKGLIWSIDAAGFNLETLIPAGLHYSPACSPDGKWLALVSEINQVRNLCLYERTTGEMVTLTKFPATYRVGSPAWSPDSKQVAFTVSVFEKVDVWLVSQDGSSLRRLTNDGYSNSPAWSPDGTKIAFTSGRQDPYRWEIWAMNADGSGQFSVTRNGGFSPSWYARPRAKSAAKISPVLKTPVPTPVPTLAVVKPAMVPVKATPTMEKIAVLPASPPTRVKPAEKKIPIPTATPLPRLTPTAKPTVLISSKKIKPQAVEEFIEDAAPPAGKTAKPSGQPSEKDEYESFEQYADKDKAVLPQEVQPEIKGQEVFFKPKIDFYFAKDLIKPTSLDTLKQLATELNKYPDAPLVVRGYLRGPSFLKNIFPILRTLSRARANSVLRHLIVNEKIRQINVTAISETDLFPELGVAKGKPILIVEVK